MVRHAVRFASWGALLLVMSGCRKTQIRATCTVRQAGSYCTFENSGRETARACFRVTVGPAAAVVAFANAYVCSGPLAPGQRSAPAPFVFAEGDPFARCDVDRATGAMRGCETRVTTERLERNP